MKTIYELSPKHLTQLHKLYAEEWWTKDRTIEETQRVVEHSTVVVGLVNVQGDLVAFARVLSDLTFKALLLDVIVAAPYRDQGLGKELMEAVLHHGKLQDVKNFELYCLPEMADFYRQYGFTDAVGGDYFYAKGGMAIMYAVIFRAKTKDLDAEYFETARRMRQLAEGYGCVDFTAVTEGSDEIAISYWESLDQIKAWKQNAEHLVAQQKGREKWYEDYTVEIVEVVGKYAG